MEQKKTIVGILEELLLMYGFSDVRVEETLSGSGNNTSKTFVLHVPEEESRFLIGQYGNNLQALQHVARMLVGHILPETVAEGSVFFLDINDYRKKKDQSVIDLARSSAREAEKEQRPVLLRPMSAYERRLVHMELAKETKVITESVGEGLDRRVQVSPLV